MQVQLTKHFSQRFKKRLANTSKIQEYAENAYYYGKDVNAAKSSSFIAKIEEKERQYGATAKIYKNYIYWFSDTIAVTIYPIPQKMHGRI